MYSDVSVPAHLYVNLMVDETDDSSGQYPFYSVHVEYDRLLTDPETGIRAYASKARPMADHLDWRMDGRVVAPSLNFHADEFA